MYLAVLEAKTPTQTSLPTLCLPHSDHGCLLVARTGQLVTVYLIPYYVQQNECFGNNFIVAHTGQLVTVYLIPYYVQQNECFGNNFIVARTGQLVTVYIFMSQQNECFGNNFTV